MEVPPAARGRLETSPEAYHHRSPRIVYGETSSRIFYPLTSNAIV